MKEYNRKEKPDETEKKILNLVDDLKYVTSVFLNINFSNEFSFGDALIIRDATIGHAFHSLFGFYKVLEEHEPDLMDEFYSDSVQMINAYLETFRKMKDEIQKKD